MPNKNNIKKDLEAKCANYVTRNYLTETMENFLRRLRRQLIIDGTSNLKNIGCVLDIGCGPAVLFPEILKAAKEYVAVDLVRANLNEIRRSNRSKKLILVEGDMDYFTWHRDYFDLIICAGTFEYTANPEDNLLRLITFLRKGGLMVGSFPNRTSPYRLWGEYVYRYFWQLKNTFLRKKHYFYPRRLFSEGKIVNLVQKWSKPEEVKVMYFGHKFLVQPFDALMKNVDHRLTVLFQGHSARWLKPFCTEFLLWIKK